MVSPESWMDLFLPQSIVNRNNNIGSIFTWVCTENQKGLSVPRIQILFHNYIDKIHIKSAEDSIG